MPIYLFPFFLISIYDYISTASIRLIAGKGKKKDDEESCGGFSIRDILNLYKTIFIFVCVSFDTVIRFSWLIIKLLCRASCLCDCAVFLPIL